MECEPVVTVNVNLSVVNRGVHTVAATPSNISEAVDAFASRLGIRAPAFAHRLTGSLKNLTHKALRRDARARAARAPQIIPERFRIGDPLAVTHFEQHGYVVFKSVVRERDTRRLQGLLWDYLESATGLGIERDRPATWQNWPQNEGSWLQRPHPLTLSHALAPKAWVSCTSAASGRAASCGKRGVSPGSAVSSSSYGEPGSCW